MILAYFGKQRVQWTFQVQYLRTLDPQPMMVFSFQRSSVFKSPLIIHSCPWEGRLEESKAVELGGHLLRGRGKDDAHPLLCTHPPSLTLVPPGSSGSQLGLPGFRLGKWPAGPLNSPY